jgi:hypothetical protein
VSSSPPTNSSAFGVPEERPQLSKHDLAYLRIWYESANIQEATAKAMIEVRTMRNKLQSIRERLRVRDDAELREYINRNGWPQPFPTSPPSPPPPPPSREFNELVAQRKLAWEILDMLAEPTMWNCPKLGLDVNVLRSTPGAYTHECFKWSDVWPGGEFRPRSPDEALIALLLRREFREIEDYTPLPGSTRRRRGPGSDFLGTRTGTYFRLLDRLRCSPPSAPSAGGPTVSARRSRIPPHPIAPDPSQLVH